MVRKHRGRYYPDRTLSCGNVTAWIWVIVVGGLALSSCSKDRKPTFAAPHTDKDAAKLFIACARIHDLKCLNRITNMEFAGQIAAYDAAQWVPQSEIPAYLKYARRILASTDQKRRRLVRLAREVAYYPMQCRITAVKEDRFHSASRLRKTKHPALVLLTQAIKQLASIVDVKFSCLNSKKKYMVKVAKLRGGKRVIVGVDGPLNPRWNGPRTWRRGSH